MDTSVQEAIKIGLVNNQIHTLVISGGTGVGKSFIVRQCLEAWQIPYRVIPVYIDMSELQESIDFEVSLAQGKMVMASSLLDDDSTHCWLIDDGHVLAPEVCHALLVEAKRRHILLIMTINHEDRTLSDAEWEFVDVHVSMNSPSLETRIDVLQRVRDEIVYESDANIGAFIENKSIQTISVPEPMISLAIAYALKAHTVGHGAEYMLLQVMKSLALLEGSSYCKPRHAELAALYVLPHRMKKAEAPESQPSPDENFSDISEEDRSQSNDTSDSMDSDVSSECEQDDGNSDANGDDIHPNESNANDAENSDIDSVKGDDADSGEANGSSNSTKSEKHLGDDATNDICDKLSSLDLPDTVACIANKLFQWKLESSKIVDRRYRKGSGRRIMTKTKDSRGRMIRAYQDEHALEDLALVDTLRAAAPYQRLRAAIKVEQDKPSIQPQQLEYQDGKELSIVIKPQDYRRKAREKRVGTYQLFVVDASGSMAARHRMEATKAAILSLLRDSYVHRDSVGLIEFRKDSAEVLLPFTHSVERAERLLASMPTGGRTPLSQGLRVAYTVCDRLLRKYSEERIQVICITDGRATSGDTKDPVAEAKQWARILGTLPVDCIVIDTETGFIKLGLAKELCKLMNGNYYAMDTISADSILRVSRR